MDLFFLILNGFCFMTLLFVLLLSTVLVRIICFLGKYDQRWLYKINLHCLSF